jgi:hypothetical protein
MEIFCDHYSSPSKFSRMQTSAEIGCNVLPEETGEPCVVVAKIKPKVDEITAQAFVFFIFPLLGVG